MRERITDRWQKGIGFEAQVEGFALKRVKPVCCYRREVWIQKPVHLSVWWQEDDELSFGGFFFFSVKKTKLYVERKCGTANYRKYYSN